MTQTYSVISWYLEAIDLLRPDGTPDSRRSVKRGETLRLEARGLAMTRLLCRLREKPFHNDLSGPSFEEDSYSRLQKFLERISRLMRTKWAWKALKGCGTQEPTSVLCPWLSPTARVPRGETRTALRADAAVELSSPAARTCQTIFPTAPPTAAWLWTSDR